MTGGGAALAPRDRHWRWAMGLTAAACTAALAAGGVPERVQFGALLVGVAVIGFPHGALDPLVAGLGLRLGSPARVLTFLGAYVVLAAFVLGLWSISPALGLALFLSTSALHFGLGDTDRREASSTSAHALRVLAHGAAPITLPAIAHPAPVSEIFGWLVGASGSAVEAWLTAAAPALGGGWLLTALAAYTLPGARRLRGAAELAALAAAFALLPPLLSFTLYFCLWHSARHLIEVHAALGGLRSGRKALVGAAVLLGTALLMGAGHRLAEVASTTPGYVRTVFIALACLTPPHMLVTALLARRGSSAECP